MTVKNNPDANRPVTDSTEVFSLEHPKVLTALEEHQEAIEAGKPVNSQDLLERFPDIASELAEVLEGMSMLCQSTASQPSAPLQPGDEFLAEPLGDYRLLREVGRGGMGIVYEARQLSLGRRVALKILPFAATLDPRQLQRFRNEAQAAACLHHPHIVPVYAVGQERGVHYYAMQFIEGHTLADPIHEMRREQAPQKAPLTQYDEQGPDLAGTITFGGGEKPAPIAPETDAQAMRATKIQSGLAQEGTQKKKQSYYRTVANLGRQAAEGLDHAHQLGVVHRDIKPANLLLDQSGQLWITDFGLAQLETDLHITKTGDLVGTLRYMSPEQAQAKRGVVDHRTDVYSLGATLYELATLQPVHDGETAQALLQQITSDEVLPLRKHKPDIPEDLETIILKALATKPEDRYATALEMAEDLQRFLRDKPIEARRPSLSSRLTRWGRRHRGVVIGSVALLALISIGLAMSTWMIWKEKARTQQAYEGEAKHRKQAEENLQQARGILHFFTQTAEEDLSEHPEAQAVRRKLLEASLKYYQDFINKAGDDPELREELSQTHFRVATILNDLGEEQKAEAAAGKAFSIHEKLVRAQPQNKALRSGLNRMYQQWGRSRSEDIIRQVSRESVRRDLGLDPQLSAKIKKLSSEHFNFFRTKGRKYGRDREQMMKAHAEERKQTAEEVAGLLSQKQKDRLKQIALQQRGVHAFADGSVQEALGLSEDQVTQIDCILEEYHDHWQKKSYSFGHRGSPQQRSFSPPKDPSDEIFKLLTEKQLMKWTSMLGKRFDNDMRFGGRGFGQFPRGGGRGGRGGGGRD